MSDNKEVVEVVEGVVEDKPKKDMTKIKEGLDRYNNWKRELKKNNPDLTRDAIKEMWIIYKVENGMPVTKPRKPKVKNVPLDLPVSAVTCGA